MDSYASPRVPEKAPDRLDRIADAVYQSLTSALREQCAHRHSLDVTVDRMTVGQPTEACLRCQNLVEMEVALAVQHVGGNVYDVHCLIDDGPSRQLVYSLPDDTEPGLPPAPRLGEQLARFVVGELEQACGRQRLQSE